MSNRVPTHREAQPRRLGEYPDKIGGYHGCQPWLRSSSLKMQGNWIKLPVLRVALNEAVANNATGPLTAREGRR
jgi:hypothetical protein